MDIMSLTAVELGKKIKAKEITVADAVEAAVQKVLTDGYRTGDIMSEGCKKVGTKEMGDLIAAAV